MDPIISVDYSDLDDDSTTAVVTFLDGRVETFTTQEDLIKIMEQLQKQSDPNYKAI